MAEVPLLVRLATPAARLPYRASAGAAGYDLHSSFPARVPARGRAVVGTGLVVQVPPGTYGRIAPRSGLALKHGIDVGAGVIDSDYRGELCVVLFNHSDDAFDIVPGARIAQLVLQRIATPEIEQVFETEATARGAAGFGSTGL